ncbi:hypothetical protein Ait01nite_034350 [Actinoplanes italicus]|uniref:hypothetical protein n=1 Tax=Actinoplanes italicus TaxID=113567 RepID=UPI000D04A1FE|nr:hypothetical protein [Actinoplanes italicus]GIE30390.1 hypothetical protein Ait01nite_034350 [Actinoplanes italicus]
MATAEVARAVARYAKRFHAAAGEGHGVASPLGAWLLLALCGAAAGRRSGSAGRELAEALGMDPASAAAAATAMLADEHPVVLSATAVWGLPEDGTQSLRAWLAALPSSTETGPIPAQPDLDRWADDHTLGLINTFPVQVPAEAVLLMATALASRVSWRDPFDIVPAEELRAGSAWAGRLTRVLSSPVRGHHGFIVTTEEAGDVIVHVAEAKVEPGEPGLSVLSVAAAPEIPPATVLAAAHTLAVELHEAGPFGQWPPQTGHLPGRRSLYDLPLGEAPLWTITEEPALTYGREERYRSVLPCWSAESEHDLSREVFGFPAALRVLEPVIGASGLDLKAKQSAVARYSRYGFEAAAVTVLMAVTGLPPEGVVRSAELRFGHPYAVVAVATDERPAEQAPWHGVPVFSAWVSDPDDVPAEEAG